MEDVLGLIGLGCAAGVALAPTARWRTGFLALTYFAMGGVLAGSVPVGIALAKAAVGLSVGSILFLSLQHGRPIDIASEAPLAGPWFRAAALALVMLPLYGAWQAGVASGLPVDPTTAVYAVLVMGAGALQVAVSGDVIGRCSGLLLTLLGFEVLFTPLEPSLALVSLMAAVHVGLSLAAGYFWTRAPTGDGVEVQR
jgi:hypothetical protein